MCKNRNHSAKTRNFSVENRTHLFLCRYFSKKQSSLAVGVEIFLLEHEIFLLKHAIMPFRVERCQKKVCCPVHYIKNFRKHIPAEVDIETLIGVYSACFPLFWGKRAFRSSETAFAPGISRLAASFTEL